MFKVFSINFTNKQHFVNKTSHQVKVTISCCDNLFYGIINGNDKGYVDVKRSQLGTIKAHVNLTFQNGIQIEYSFGVEAKNCTDHIDIHDSHVIFNKKQRGKRTSEPTPELISLEETSSPSQSISPSISIDLTQLSINALRDICCQKNISTSGCKTKQDYITKLQLPNDQLSLI
jgi:hypothetical protein